MSKEDEKETKRKEPVTVESTKEIEPRKTGVSILRQEIQEGLTESRRSATGLFLSGLSAGLDLGFSVILMAILRTLDPGILNPVTREILIALAYSIGFIFVILGDSELFTEHTTLAVFPLLNRNSSFLDLIRLWGIVYVSNLVGAALIAFGITEVGPGMGIINPSVFGEMAQRMTDHTWLMILLSGVFAGWLMGLVSWLVTASRETISQIAIILLVTGTIGFAHLHHSIAGSIEVLAGVFSGQGVSLFDYGHFLLWTTLGNIIGGVFLVGIVKYGHVIRAGIPEEPVEVRSK